MTTTLKTLASEVRRVWNPPGGRPWSYADVAIVKLLRTIEDAPDQPEETRNEILEKAALAIEEAFSRDLDVAAIDVVRGLKR
jgi:hypothetical protein